MIAVRKYKQFITFYKYIITSISYGISYVDLRPAMCMKAAHKETVPIMKMYRNPSIKQCETFKWISVSRANLCTILPAPPILLL